MSGRGRLLFVGVLTLASGCVASESETDALADEGETDGTDTDGSGDTEDIEPMTTAMPSAISWVLGWDLSGAEFGGGEGSLTTDLGYVVELEAGWVSSYAGTLVPCGRALTGHSTEDDPSLQGFDRVEDLLAFAELDGDADGPWTIPLAEVAYCGGHYLMAPAGEGSDAVAEADPAMLGATLLLRGHWRAPGSDEAVPFEIRSEQAYGKILELELETPDVAEPGATLEVRLARQLGTLFDGLVFESLADDPDAGAWLVLGNLGKQTHLQLRTR